MYTLVSAAEGEELVAVGTIWGRAIWRGGTALHAVFTRGTNRARSHCCCGCRSALLCSAVLCPSAPACCPSVPDRSLSRHDKISPPPPNTDAPHTSHLTPLTSHLPPPTNAHPVLAIHVPCPSTISVLSCPDLLVLVLQLVLVLETGNSIVLPSRAPVFHPPPPLPCPLSVRRLLSLTHLSLPCVGLLVP